MRELEQIKRELMALSILISLKHQQGIPLRITNPNDYEANRQAYLEWQVYLNELKGLQDNVRKLEAERDVYSMEELL